jgi:hypothetical protein
MSIGKPRERGYIDIANLALGDLNKPSPADRRRITPAVPKVQRAAALLLAMHKEGGALSKCFLKRDAIMTSTLGKYPKEAAERLSGPR